MSFDPKLDNKTRFLVLYLDVKMKAETISNILGRSLRTIQDWASKTNKAKGH